MTVYLADPDVTLHHGDVLDVLRAMPDASVDCCVTSPPYYGLRDYGTGSWDGGDPGCDHRAFAYPRDRETPGGRGGSMPMSENVYRDACGKCGATRVDRQIGLEPTLDAYVQKMVDVFREIRRVLADHGTCWVNLGDSYGSGETGRVDAPQKAPGLAAAQAPRADRRIAQFTATKPKDLLGVPWRVAFALQADGWWLRSDIVWAKPNPMPESVTDRPTKAHEYVFLLTKQPRYWFDQEAVREKYQPSTVERDAYGYNHAFANQFKGSPTDGRHQDGKQLPPGSFAKGPDGRKNTRVIGADGSIQHRDGERWPNGGRNVRSVWEIATQPFPEAHFATFPEELVRRCVLAGCPEWVCRVCGRPRERLVDVDEALAASRRGTDAYQSGGVTRGATWAGTTPGVRKQATTVGWSDCGHANYRPGVVLDPFVGSGTTAVVARKHGRRCVGIDLSADYLELAARRTQQLSLLAETTDG